MGKTTQLRLLGEGIRAGGHDVLTVREPGGTPVGDAIRAVLLDPASDITPWAEALLFMASRAQLVARVIRPALARGTTVLVDRFFLSTYAYQSFARGLDPGEIADMNRVATGGLVPDLTILLRLPVREGLARAARRGTHDRMEGADTTFHDRVAHAFDRFATAEWQAAHPECGPVIAVDAGGTPDEVFVRVRDAVAVGCPGTFSGASQSKQGI